jgi:RHS repeat-associated protein
VGQIAFTNGSALRMTTTKQYDSLNRLMSITNLPAGSAAIGYRYAYNSANQRTSVTNADSARWVYQYDSLGQVVSGKRYWSDGTPVAGQQFEYTFDDIGNRKSTGRGGDESGVGLRSASYTNNALNQLTGRDVPGYLDVLGSATNTAMVAVNNQATYRHDDYFRVELAANNGSAAFWFGVTNLAGLNNGTNADIIASTTGFVFVAQSPEIFRYDADGNMTNDGRWILTWDGENRLITMVSLTNGPADSKRRLIFGYDYYGRRITKAAERWNGSSWVTTSSNRFLYDSWNLIAELNATNNAVIRSYVWGLDLSGSIQGAGGVGGLLAVNDAANSSHFCVYDGNGNIAALAKAADGTVSANYEYGPFDELIRASGPVTKTNPLRFSTKYQDDETDFIYYGFRYYNPSTGRWLSRDPIKEASGPNLYGFLGNNSVTRVDVLGLWDFAGHLEIGMGAIRNAGIAMTAEEVECFRRGLILPDLPFLDTRNAGSSLDWLPLAGGLGLKYAVDEVTDPILKSIDETKNQLWFLDADDPFTWMGLASKPLRERLQYWWDDSNFLGPVVTRIPYVNRTDTVRTHWGDLSYRHSMGNAGADPAVLQATMVKYVDQLMRSYRERLCEDPCRAYLELGMALHTLADSWAGGHTVRGPGGAIQLFQDYNGQSLHYHEHHDLVSEATSKNFNSAVSASLLMILQATGGSQIDSSTFFPLAPGAAVGLLPGTEEVGLWKTLINGIPHGY